MCGVLFDAGDASAAARGEFVGDATGAGEEVEDGDSFKVDDVGKDVEEIFFCEICCRAGVE